MSDNFWFFFQRRKNEFQLSLREGFRIKVIESLKIETGVAIEIIETIWSMYP